MYLSDAMRQGCIGTYKIQDRLFDGNGGACVVGAAILAYYKKVTPLLGIPAEWRWAYCYRRHGGTSWDHYVRLNNETNLTREDIADLVELDEWSLGIRVEEPKPAEPASVERGLCHV